jgi:hypothetical protein
MPLRQARNRIRRLRSSSAALLNIEPDMDDLSCAPAFPANAVRAGPVPGHPALFVVAGFGADSDSGGQTEERRFRAGGVARL